MMATEPGRRARADVEAIRAWTARGGSQGAPAETDRLHRMGLVDRSGAPTELGRATLRFRRARQR